MVDLGIKDCNYDKLLGHFLKIINAFRVGTTYCIQFSLLTKFTIIEGLETLDICHFIIAVTIV
jgi:hypothetical protein